MYYVVMWHVIERRVCVVCCAECLILHSTQHDMLPRHHTINRAFVGVLTT